MKGRSTALQLLCIMDEWTTLLDSGAQVDVIYYTMLAGLMRNALIILSGGRGYIGPGRHRRRYSTFAPSSDTCPRNDPHQGRSTWQWLSGRGGVRGGKCRRLSVTSTAAAAAVMVGGVFVCSGTTPSYRLLAQRQPALHSRLRLLWPGNRHRASRGSIWHPLTVSRPLPRAHTTSGRGFSDFCRF